MATVTKKDTKTHVVVKGFRADGKTLTPGQEVDASNWPNMKKLEDHKFIRPLHSQEVLREFMQTFVEMQKSSGKE